MNTIALSRTTEELKARFEIDGFVNFGRILTDEELRALSTRVDEICDGVVEMPDGVLKFHQGWTPESEIPRRNAVWQVLHAHQHDEVILEICEKPLIRETIELFLDGEAQLWGTQIIMKPAHHGGATPWHQDSSYWGQEKRMTCWLAIDDATPFNGCMRMIPGSHKLGQVEFTPMKNDQYGLDLLEASVSEDTQLYVPVRAGCASFHHPMTLHASDPNTTPHRRRAVAITYMKTSP